MTDGGRLPGNSSSGQLRARNYPSMRTDTQAREAPRRGEPTFRIPHRILYYTICTIYTHTPTHYMYMYIIYRAFHAKSTGSWPSYSLQ